MEDSIINDAENNVFNDDESNYYNKNDDNNVNDIMNENNSESMEIINDNDIVANDADNANTIIGVTTNLSRVFDNIIEKNNISSDSIEKCIENIDENIFESCDRSSDDSNDVIVVNKYDYIIAYDILYSKYIDVCATNRTLLEQKNDYG
jgi:hypothetical protein